jgi:T5SS/PEP-CTERM-associated repeat protein
VTGSGSVWSNRIGLVVGYGGPGNSLVISNGGKVVVAGLWGIVGEHSSASNNSVRVADHGSWIAHSRLVVGYSGSSNLLTIAGGSVVASNVLIGDLGFASNNVIQVTSGSLFVTNNLGNGSLFVSRAFGKGSLILSGGSVTVDALIATNGPNSVVTLNGGLLNSKGTAVANSQVFVIGDGTNSGTLHLLDGAHSFNNGLRVRANSFLTGCGTIDGKVWVDAGATVLADCSGSLTFTASVTNNGVMIADKGSVLASSGTLVNNGTILLLSGGTTNFHGTFINNGTILNGDTHLAIARDGTAFSLRITTTPDVTYRVQRTSSMTGPWSDLATNTAPASGLIEYHDTSPLPGQAFYRAVTP